MKFALFFEIPVARPWQRDSEHRAYREVVDQAVLGEQAAAHVIDRAGPVGLVLLVHIQRDTSVRPEVQFSYAWRRYTPTTRDGS